MIEKIVLVQAQVVEGIVSCFTAAKHFAFVEPVLGGKRIRIHCDQGGEIEVGLTEGSFIYSRKTGGLELPHMGKGVALIRLSEDPSDSEYTLAACWFTLGYYNTAVGIGTEEPADKMASASSRVSLKSIHESKYRKKKLMQEYPDE